MNKFGNSEFSENLESNSRLNESSSSAKNAHVVNLSNYNRQVINPDFYFLRFMSFSKTLALKSLKYFSDKILNLF